MSFSDENSSIFSSNKMDKRKILEEELYSSDYFESAEEAALIKQIEEENKSEQQEEIERFAEFKMMNLDLGEQSLSSEEHEKLFEKVKDPNSTKYYDYINMKSQKEYEREL